MDLVEDLDEKQKGTAERDIAAAQYCTLFQNQMSR
jgi:hypothetical protein